MLPIPICWYLKTLKFALPPMRMLKFALPLTQTPNTKRWNIGRVGSPTQNSPVGHVHFICVCVDLIRVGYRFSVEYGLMVAQYSY